jgi:hypothetical protein
MKTIVLGGSLAFAVGAICAIVPVTAAHAQPVLGFNFSNAMDGDTVVAPSLLAPPVTAASWNTGGPNGVESNVYNIPGMYSLTRNFGEYSPAMSFTTSSALTDLSLSFFTIQNHNFSYDSTYSVDVELTPLNGTASLLGSFLAGPGQTTYETLNFAVPDLAAGSYTIDWVLAPGSLEDGATDTGSDYFGLTDVSLAVPEPGTVGIAAMGLVMLGLARRRVA